LQCGAMRSERGTLACVRCIVWHGIGRKVSRVHLCVRGGCEGEREREGGRHRIHGHAYFHVDVDIDVGGRRYS
jgi:hypothetical protein